MSHPTPPRHRAEHIEPVRTYALVWVALLFATGLTTVAALVDLGPFNTVAALAIAAGKMLLVALFFMHVRHSPKLTVLVVLGGLLWLSILLTLSMADFATRGWIGIPGK